MSKLQLIYIPKVAGEPSEFKIIRSLKNCMEYYKGKNNILSSPGYMGRMTSVNTFVTKFKEIVPPGDRVYIGYFKGLTGKMNPSGSTDIIDEFYLELLSTRKFKKLSITIADKPDHRKMMFFFGINEDASFDFKRETLSLLTKDRFLNSITVNAVLVGSSNQSKTTYYGGASGHADKGETDILMYVNDGSRVPRFTDGTVIFEAVLGLSDTPHEYLKEMLRDFLSRSLS